MLEIHEDTCGQLTVWRDCYEWVDPFSEAEEWALRWGYMRLAFDRRKYEAARATQEMNLRERESRIVKVEK